MPAAHGVSVGTDDGVRLAGVHLPAGPGAARPELAVVVAHGFTVHTARPEVRRLLHRLRARVGVLALDFRGHGRSGGLSSVGDAEVLDLDAAVGEALRLGYRQVASLGFSMGGAVALRHAAGAATSGGLRPRHPVRAVASVSAPSRWYVRDTVPMRRLHWLCETGAGRLVAATVLGTRIGVSWPAVPESPARVVGRIPPTPLLLVHGDRDPYFPLSHLEALAAAAGPGARTEVVPGFGHAEGALRPEVLDWVAGWIVAATGTAAGPDAGMPDAGTPDAGTDGDGALPAPADRPRNARDRSGDRARDRHPSGSAGGSGSGTIRP